MNKRTILYTMILFFSGCLAREAQMNKPVVYIILGSTRDGRLSDKIGKTIIKLIDVHEVCAEIIDLRDYPLPFLADAVPPADRKVITDPAVKKWSDKIKQADAFIIVAPEYNAGYPGVLKNALDSLYVEWNNKPVALVTYSGGPSGGARVYAQLKEVLTHGLKMVLAPKHIMIPSSYKAFNADGSLADRSIEKQINEIIKQLQGALKKK